MGAVLEEGVQRLGSRGRRNFTLASCLMQHLKFPLTLRKPPFMLLRLPYVNAVKNAAFMFTVHQCDEHNMALLMFSRPPMHIQFAVFSPIHIRVSHPNIYTVTAIPHTPLYHQRSAAKRTRFPITPHRTITY